MKQYGFEGLFAPRILQRGADYAREGRITIVQNERAECLALAHGTETYHVTIAYGEDGQIRAMHCDCPYAEDGRNCKHMAATLYALQERPRREMSTMQQPVVRRPECTEKMIEALDEKTVRSLLLMQAQKDPRLCDTIRRYFAEADEMSVAEWKESLSWLAEEYADEDGYIAYEDAYSFYSELSDYLDEEAGELLEKERYADAFAMSCAVYMTAVEQEADDSDGGLTAVIMDCAELWSSIYDAADITLRRRMYDWFFKLIMEMDCDIIGTLQELLLVEFEEPEFRERSRRLLDEELERAHPWELGTLLCQRLDIASDDERPALLNQYGEHPAVRRWQVGACIAQGELETAVTLLEQELASDTEEVWQRGNLATLIDLYKRLSRTEKYYNALKTYVLDYDQRDLDKVHCLKEATPPEQWPQWREKLIASKTMRDVLVPFLAEEEQWDRLLVLAQTGMDERLLQYEGELKKRFPEQMLQIWLDEAQRRIAAASERRGYRDAVRTLKRARAYPEGRHRARELADQWRTAYPRRTALLDELNKGGFRDETPKSNL